MSDSDEAALSAQPAPLVDVASSETTWSGDRQQQGFQPPINVMVVDDANRVARVLFRMNGERVVTVL